MTAIDRDLLKALRADMDAALAIVGAKHGVTINTGNASFSESSATFKVLIVGQAPEEGTTAKDLKAAQDLKALAPLFGADAKWAGKSFKSPTGQTFTVIGLLPSRPKRCILARSQAGRDFIFQPSTVRDCMGA